jgi:aquaporin Z
MEAVELGLFMMSASVFTLLLYHPASPIISKLPSELFRRSLTGLAMGLTAIALIYSPWGKRSGAHMNPAVTLTFFRLGKVAGWDALFYITAQFLGSVAGILCVALFANRLLSDPAINYVATLPGPAGALAAFTAETVISFTLFLVVLLVSGSRKTAHLTGVFAGCCVALFIIVESPISGMSMNPARSFGSALIPQLWMSLWIYFTAPVVGMLLAAEVYPMFKGRVACAKLHHENKYRCIFCDFHLRKQRPATDAHSNIVRTFSPSRLT